MNPDLTDPKVTLADLYKSIESIRELIEDRDALLRSMFKEDLYNDFLMQEAQQSAPMIAAMEGGDPDLSATPEMPDEVNYERLQQGRDDRGLSVAEGLEKNEQKENQLEKDRPTDKFKAGGLLGGGGTNNDAFSPADSTSSQSLEETGFDDTFEKNISDKLEKDFQIDGRLKEAFGASLALPMKAAAAGLMQVFKMIPQIGIGGNINNIVNNNLNSISKNLGISSENVTQTGDTASTNLFQSVVNSGVNNFLGMGGNGANGMHGANGANGSPGSTGSSIAGDNKFLNSVMNSTTLADSRTSGGNRFNILNPFGGMQKGLIEGNKAREGTRGHDTSGTPLGNMLNHNNRTQQMINQLMSSTTNMNSSNGGLNLSSFTTGDSSIALLTDTVINEGNDLLMIEDQSIQKQAEEMANPPNPTGPNMEMESGFADAIADVKSVSDVFLEYASTAQFS